MAEKLEEFQRLCAYTTTVNNNGLNMSQMIPEAHRPSSCNSSVTNVAAMPNFSQHFNGEREKLLQQYQLNYLNFGLPAGPAFQSLPPSRIPSPHNQYQRKPGSPQSFNRSSPNFPSPPPAHMKRSASVSSRQSRDSTSPPVHQSSSWSFEEQFKQVTTHFFGLWCLVCQDLKSVSEFVGWSPGCARNLSQTPIFWHENAQPSPS